MNQGRKSRAGFTLIELLVVIAIIAILIGLLLPAVQKVREAAARMQCSNNLKQLALAVHGFQDSEGRIPYSSSPNTYGYGDTGKSWSWLTRILPYIEQGNLYSQIGITGAPATWPTFNQRQMQHSTQIKTYLCPSDNSSTQVSHNRANGSTAAGCGNTNYKGVSGNNWAWGTYQFTGPTGNRNGLDVGNGMFYRSDDGRSLRLEQMSDGTSNTYMIGEDIPGLNLHCGWPRANYSVGTCAIPLNSGMVAGQPGFGNPGDWPDLYSFRSRHTNGANFAIADGGVRFISQSIDLTVYRGFASHSGGEVVTSN